MLRDYRNAIFKQLYFNPSLSCTEISLRIGKSLPYSTRMLNDMIAQGYVQEEGFAASTGGRRAMTYSLRPDVMYVVSVAMDQFITRMAIMDMENNTVSPVHKIDLPLAGNDEALTVLGNHLAALIHDSGIPVEKLAGIGIGMPGFVDVTKGLNYSFLETGGKSINTILEKRTGLPVFIDNDSRLIALAEERFGVARGKKNAMVINVGWGIGLGMIVAGELFSGYNGFAGEFSHIPLFLNGKLCSCGKTGCLETEASLLVVVEKAREGLKNGRQCRFRSLPDDCEEACDIILDAAVNGDQFSIELLSEAAFNIGRGIAILIHIMNPEFIVISGRGAKAGKVWEAPVQQALNQYCIPRLAAYTHLTVSDALGDKAELIGAASLVVEKLGKKNVLAILDKPREKGREPTLP